MELGLVHDVLYYGAKDEEIRLEIRNQEQVFSCTFAADEGRSDNPFLSVAAVSNPHTFLSSDEAFAFTYLTAERQGPRDASVIQSESMASMGVGIRGEYVADVLAAYEQEPVRDALLQIPGPDGPDANRRLRHIVQSWMRELAPGIQVRATRFTDANMATIRFKSASFDSEWVRPSNYGFGLSYCLPIFVAGLLATNGSMLIVENPEAHLHPAGQSTLGRFLATVAASGVHVVAETHSDHIINGIRLACVDSHPIKTSEVVIYHVGLDESPAIERIGVTGKGNLTKWPRDFFDQSERDLSRILRARNAE